MSEAWRPSTHHGACVEIRRQLVSQVVRLGGKYPYLLDHLASPSPLLAVEEKNANMSSNRRE